MRNFNHPDNFVNRHIGPNKNEIDDMLRTVGVNTIDQLIKDTIPEDIRLKESLVLNEPLSEYEFLSKLKIIAQKNKIFKSYIGMGYHPVITPAVIQRNILENPGWYTPYTPYQAEISQGRLEALLNFQTMIMDLTGMKIANASLLDEGTAAAEAMAMFYSLRKQGKIASKTFFISEGCFPQTIDVLRTRANPLGIEILIGDHNKFIPDEKIFGILLQYPIDFGEAYNYKDIIAKAHEKNIFTIVASDLLSLTLLTPPGEFGADAVVGNTQRFGVPMGYGGPHAAYFATSEEFKRNIPGRIIGISKDSNGNPAFRMALQTREQHIRREKATSNICTAQVLLAIIAGMYAVYYGPAGLKAIAERINKLTKLIDLALRELGFKQLNKNYFDTLLIKFDYKTKELIHTIEKLSLSKSINFRYADDSIGISINETTSLSDVLEIIDIFALAINKTADKEVILKLVGKVEVNFDNDLLRKSSYLQHPVFNSFHSETEMLRYLKQLENKDLSLTHSMIPLGSCTMKLNAVSEMFGISWPEFNGLHPFAPRDQAQGYSELFCELEKDLAEITGFKAISFQPNSGAQGEYTGLLVIREYLRNKGEGHRNVVVIPSSAHGTNPASAVMAGMKVVVVNCDDNGDVDLDDLRRKSRSE